MVSRTIQHPGQYRWQTPGGSEALGTVDDEPNTSKHYRQNLRFVPGNISFQTYHVGGLPLDHAFVSNFMDLVDRDQPAFPALGRDKFVLRVKWPGPTGNGVGYEPYNHSIRAVTDSGQPVTKAMLGFQVAKAVKYFIDINEFVASYDDNWRVGPNHIRLEHISLQEVRWIDGGFLEPVLLVRK
ncbi:hypothetical protein B0H21DRAFT_820084 [Amylocystis lapponica]|nr:hypothetical protein B0H21DRAFT_820084 [Amylocystis lapponica]